MKKFLIVLGVLGTLSLVGIGGCAVLVGSAVDSVDKALDEEVANDKPVTVKEGEAFTHDGYKVDKGWTVGQKYGSPVIKDLTVTNVDHEVVSDDYPLFTVTLWKGKQAAAEVEASGNAIQPGQSTPMDSYSMASKVPAFDTITVKDMW